MRVSFRPHQRSRPRRDLEAQPAPAACRDIRVPLEAERVQRPSQMAGERAVGKRVQRLPSYRLLLHQFALRRDHCAAPN